MEVKTEQNLDKWNHSIKEEKNGTSISAKKNYAND